MQTWQVRIIDRTALTFTILVEGQYAHAARRYEELKQEGQEVVLIPR